MWTTLYPNYVHLIDDVVGVGHHLGCHLHAPDWLRMILQMLHLHADKTLKERPSHCLRAGASLREVTNGSQHENMFDFKSLIIISVLAHYMHIYVSGIA